jgi:hypothetical protein
VRGSLYVTRPRAISLSTAPPFPHRTQVRLAALSVQPSIWSYLATQTRPLASYSVTTRQGYNVKQALHIGLEIL